MVSRLGEGHMPCTFFLSEPQLKTTVVHGAKIYPCQIALMPKCPHADKNVRAEMSLHEMSGAEISPSLSR